MQPAHQRTASMHFERPAPWRPALGSRTRDPGTPGTLGTLVRARDFPAQSGSNLSRQLRISSAALAGVDNCDAVATFRATGEDAGALGWTEVSTAERADSALRREPNSSPARNWLPATKSMVYQLALHLWRPRRALDLSRVFLRVFRPFPAFAARRRFGPGSTASINQARNRQRWWRRRHRSDQVNWAARPRAAICASR